METRKQYRRSKSQVQFLGRTKKCTISICEVCTFTWHRTPVKRTKTVITPKHIFNYHFEDFLQGVVLKASQGRYEAEKDQLRHRIKTAPTLMEIRQVVLAVLIIILNKQRWTKHYWCTSSSLRGIPLMNSVISRDKFWALYPLVFSWEVIEGEVYFNRKFKEVYSPSSYISIDELMCKFKGRTKMKVYMPRKRIKTGIKIWSLNDSTPEATYLWDFVTSQGRVRG